MDSNGDQPIKKQKTGNSITKRDFVRDSIVEDLPGHLMYEILLRSPAESLIGFKSVCKDWYALIKDRKFVKQYFDHHKGNNDSTGIVLMTAIFDFDYHDDFNLANLNKLCEYDVDRDVGMVAEECEIELTWTQRFMVYPLRLSTCNGLVCVYREVPVLVWNPVTKEFIKLSKPKLEEKEDVAPGCGCGFGYDAAKDEYKVVQLFCHPSDSSLDCMVLNLGTNMSWRRIQHQDNFLHPNLEYLDDCLRSIFADGSIYWWTYGDILCFDVSAEIFNVIPAPAPIQNSKCPHQQQRLGSCATTTDLVELEKNLCFVQHYACGRVMDVWMLQKDCAQMKTPWVKGYTINLDCISKHTYYDNDIKSICVRNKKIYLVCGNGLACYDKETKESKIVFHGVSEYFENEAVAYTKSIVCLKDIFGSKCGSTVHTGECEECRRSWSMGPKINLGGQCSVV